MMTATEDSEIRSALTSWLQSEDHGKREKLLRMIRNWWDSNNAVEFMEKTQIFPRCSKRGLSNSDPGSARPAHRVLFQR